MTKEQRLKKRHNAEKRFRFYGLASIFFALLFVLILVHNIFSKGSSAFMKTAINVEVFYDKDLLELEPGASEEEILEADFFDITIESLLKVYPAKNMDEEDALIELFTTDAEIEIKKAFLNNKNYVFDAGSRSTANFISEGSLEAANIEAVFITHTHSDHIGSLGELILASWGRGRTSSLPVYGAGKEIQDVVDGFNLAYKPDRDHRTAHHGQEFFLPENGLLQAQLFEVKENELLIFEDANNDATIGRNLTVTGDLTITGDDITMNTNTSGAALIGDGTNFNPVAISGDITIAANGTAAIGSGVIVNADINSSAAIADSKLATISTAGKVDIGALEIDGATDIGGALADADLFIVDDGANGTERKMAASRILTYVGASAGAFSIANLDIDGGTDIGANLADSDLFIVDDGAGGTNRKLAASRIATYVGASAGAFSIANLDIDGGTDIGEALADADLLVVDNGAGGTNRKMAASRLQTYIEGKISGDITISSGTAAIGSGVIVNADINSSAAIADSKLATISTAGKVDIGALEIDGATDIGADLADADLIIVDDGGGGTERKAALSRMKTYIGDPTALAIALG